MTSQAQLTTLVYLVQLSHTSSLFHLIFTRKRRKERSARRSCSTSGSCTAASGRAVQGHHGPEELSSDSTLLGTASVDVSDASSPGRPLCLLPVSALRSQAPKDRVSMCVNPQSEQAARPGAVSKQVRNID